MNNITEFYTDNLTGQPVKFIITKYDINLELKSITVMYKKLIYNIQKDVLLNTENKNYIIQDSDNNPLLISPEENQPVTTDFSDWVNFVTSGEVMQDIFFDSTIPKILAKNNITV